MHGATLPAIDDGAALAEELIDTVGRVGGPALVVLALLLAFAEGALLLDLLVPGEVGLVVAGAAAAESGVPLWTIIAAAAIGSVAGDSVGYWLGRRFGDRAVNRWRWSRRRLAPRLERARRHFERRGGASVAFARWVGALRAVVPVVAGAAAMGYRRFVAWDVPSAIAWAATVSSLGYILGDDIASTVDRVGTAASVAVVAAVIAVLVFRRYRRSRRAAPVR